MRMLLSYLSKKVAMRKARFHPGLIFGLISLAWDGIYSYEYGVHFNLHILSECFVWFLTTFTYYHATADIIQ